MLKVENLKYEYENMKFNFDFEAKQLLYLVI